MQFAPVIDIILDAFVEEDMQHLQLEFIFIAFDIIYIKFQYVFCFHSQAGSIKRKCRLFFCGNAYTHFDGIACTDTTLVHVQLFLIIQHGDHIFKAVIEQLGDAGGIILLLEAVAYNMNILIDLFSFVKGIDDIDIVSVRSFQVNIVLQRFFYNEAEMRALGAIAVMVFAFVFVLFKCVLKQLLGLIDLHADLGEIRDLQRRAILIDQGFNIHIIVEQVLILQLESFLRKVEGLLYKAFISIIHRLKSCF